MAATTIEWTDRSINPIRARHRGSLGHYCEKISPGCANCYASAFQPRFGLPPFGGQLGNPSVKPFLDHDKLGEVVHARKPAKFFWCDMTDLFGRWVPEEWIDDCFATMALAGDHVHQVLTKRADNLCAYMRKRGRQSRVLRAMERLAKKWRIGDFLFDFWPLTNVWLGISAENQTNYDRRIDLLKQTPAAVRFVSAEPMLGPINFGLNNTYEQWANGGGPNECKHGIARGLPCAACTRIDWLILGGESGHNARPCDASWILDSVKQCEAAGVAAFVKQLGRRVEVGGYHAQLRGPLWTWAMKRGGVVRADGVAEVALKDSKGGDPAEWPEGLRVREFPR